MGKYDLRVEHMKSIQGVGLYDVKALYSGPQGDFMRLVFGEQIHIGGMKASIELAQQAGIGAGMKGVDLCCCNGAGARMLVRFCKVVSMIGVDATESVVQTARARCREDGLDDRIEIILADACETGLPSGSADFVWGEDAWCYVTDKPKLIAEAARLVRRGGVVAFTDWVEGPGGLSDAEAQEFLAMMSFANVQDVGGYARLLSENGCEVESAEDTRRFAPHMELYLKMIEMQLTYDVLRTLAFRQDLLKTLTDGFRFLGALSRAGKIIQARFIARRI
jgi:sarcosine/dimethylglycine N-methyltransferase